MFVQNHTPKDLDARLIDIDEQFTKRSTPLRLRSLEAFKLLHGSVPDGELRNSLFTPIAAWFIERYGDRAKWDGVIARVPILIRKNLYLFVVPAITGDTILRVTDFVEGLPQTIGASLSEDETRALLETAMLSASAAHKIYNLSIDDIHFSAEERELLQRALFDLENASTSLKASEDTQGAIFNAHAAAEKFLKIGIKRAGVSDNLMSHNMPMLFDRLVALRSTYSWLKGAVDALQALAMDMNIRYRLVPRNLTEAVSAIYISLNICGMLAQVWLFDLARNTTKSSFVPGRFYVDGRRAKFYCDRFEPIASGTPGAVLMSFGGPNDSFISEMSLDQEASALYLEITDASECAGMQAEFEAQRKRCQTQVDPTKAGFAVHSKPEGNYAGGILRFPTSKKR